MRLGEAAGEALCEGVAMPLALGEAVPVRDGDAAIDAVAVREAEDATCARVRAAWRWGGGPLARSSCCSSRARALRTDLVVDAALVVLAVAVAEAVPLDVRLGGELGLIEGEGEGSGTCVAEADRPAMAGAVDHSPVPGWHGMVARAAANSALGDCAVYTLTVSAVSIDAAHVPVSSTQVLAYCTTTVDAAAEQLTAVAPSSPRAATPLAGSSERAPPPGGTRVVAPPVMVASAAAIAALAAAADALPAG